MSSIRIGASGVANVCGYGFESIRSYWEIKTGRKERPDTVWMQRGRENELRAITAVECDMGLLFSSTGSSFDDQHRLEAQFSDPVAWKLVMYPDGVLDETMLEVKCPRQLHDEVPMGYQIQMQIGFMLGGFERALYAEWTPRETRKWWVYPSRELGEQLMPWIKRFVGYIAKDTEPPDFRTVKKPTLSTLKTELIYAT